MLLTLVNSYKLKLTQLQKAILRVLYKKNGHPINQRQLALHLDVSPPAIKKSLSVLIEAQYILVTKDHASNRVDIRLNEFNHRVMQLKRVDNLKQLYESGLVDFLEEQYAGATIIIFGSYSRGDDSVSSDIDVAIIGRTQKSIALDKYEQYLERSIHMLFFESFNSIHKHLMENLANGIVLCGGFEL